MFYPCGYFSIGFINAVFFILRTLLNIHILIDWQTFFSKSNRYTLKIICVILRGCYFKIYSFIVYHKALNDNDIECQLYEVTCETTYGHALLKYGEDNG